MNNPSKITAIPASIGRLTLLESVDLQNNAIESLGPFAKGAACPDNTKKEGSKDTIVKLFGSNGVCKKNTTSYIDGYDSDTVRVLHFLIQL